MKTATYDKMTEAERDAAALAEMQADLSGRKAIPVVAVRGVPFVDVRALRKALGMTQKAFSERFGFSLAAVRNWEQHRRLPDRAARVLLSVIADEPERVERIAREAF